MKRSRTSDAVGAADPLQADEDASVRSRRDARSAAAISREPVVWVKRVGVPGMNYDKVRSKFEDVADVMAAVVEERHMAVDPSSFTLLHVVAQGERPSSEDEAAAVPLEATLSLSEAITRARPGHDIGSRVWLLAASSRSPDSTAPSAPLPRLPLDVHPTAEYDGLLRDAELTRFYAAVRATEPTPAGDGSGVTLWRLWDPAAPAIALQWPLLEQFVLIERDFYAGFYHGDAWLASLPAEGPQRKVAVLGQPGIGKSSFGLWLLAQLLRADRTVVYSRNSAKRGSPPDMDHFVFHRGVAFELTGGDSSPAARVLLKAPAVVHICDSCKPRMRAACHKILITSPDPLIWRFFVEKEGAREAFFPLYSDAELAALRDAEFGDSLPQEVMVQRVRAWGPVPRQVFSRNRRRVRASMLEALSGENMDSLEVAMTDVMTSKDHPSNDTPHSLFLVSADRDTFEQGSVKFRSVATATRVMRTLATHQYDNILTAMQQLMESGHTRAVAGSLFETLAMERLGRGGRFLIRPLQFLDDKATTAASTTASWLTLPRASGTWPFRTLSEVTAAIKANRLSLGKHRFVPSTRNFAAIDSIEPGLRLMQMTATRNRHVLRVTSGRSANEGLAPIATHLLPLRPRRWEGDHAYLEVFFVVPQGIASTFTPQALKFHKSSASAATGPFAIPSTSTKGNFNLAFQVEGKTVEVRQYVLEFSLEEFRSTVAVDDEPDPDDIDLAANT